MPRVLVLAAKSRDVLDLDPKAMFRAQIFDDDSARALWTCTHDHATAVEAQMCGVHHLTGSIIELPSPDQRLLGPPITPK
jgi:hypothetical protein